MLLRLNRIPIAVRVTLVFAGAMALVLAGVGVFLYLRLSAELTATIEQNLRSRAADVTALIRQADSGLSDAGRSPLTERGENLSQILSSGGRVIDSSPLLRDGPLLSSAELRRAIEHTVYLTSSRGGEPARLLATPVDAQDQRLVVVVGTPLDERDDAVRNLGRLLLIGGPFALLLAALAGFVALTMALRPVESMRRRAAAIEDAVSPARLPVPAANDVISRLGRTLNEMLGRLEASVARERRFVSDASHELRTPLTVLKGELEIALLRKRSAEELESALRTAAVETDRLVQLAEDLLVIARVDQGRLPVRAAELDVSEVLHGVQQRFAQRAADQGVRLEVRDCRGLLLVADALRLEQALGNLVDNALRHGAGRVELACEASSVGVALHVCDDGEGFPPEFISAAFERFTRADHARGRGGAGLGLSIVEAIARAHGGSVGARNRDGGGADVWLCVPQRPRDVTAAL